MRGKGNDPNYYFISFKSEECPIHKTFFCGCMDTESEYIVIRKYIDFYKYCSQIFTYSNGNIKYIKTNSKNQLKFTIE